MATRTKYGETSITVARPSGTAPAETVETPVADRHGVDLDPESLDVGLDDHGYQSAVSFTGKHGVGFAYGVSVRNFSRPVSQDCDLSSR